MNSSIIEGYHKYDDILYGFGEALLDYDLLSHPDCRCRGGNDKENVPLSNHVDEVHRRLEKYAGYFSDDKHDSNGTSSQEPVAKLPVDYNMIYNVFGGRGFPRHHPHPPHHHPTLEKPRSRDAIRNPLTKKWSEDKWSEDKKLG